MQPPSQDPTNPSGQWYQPSPQRNYPSGEEAYYNQFPQGGGPMTRYPTGNQGKLSVPPGSPKPRNGWKVVSLVLFILVLILAATTTALFLTRPSSSAGQQVGRATPSSAATQPVLQATPTAVATQPTQPTPTAANSNDYSAAQPGPGCDTNGGTWTPQGISHITCGTYVLTATQTTWGYLYLQLPNHETFSANNTLSVTGNFDSFSPDCFGLAEQDANTGYLVAYCGTGEWFIYSISNQGAILKTLSSNTTSTRTNTTISLTLKNTTLSFAIDTEIHQVTISPIQPVKVALGYFDTGYGGPGITATNFGYETSAS